MSNSGLMGQGELGIRIGVPGLGYHDRDIKTGILGLGYILGWGYYQRYLFGSHRSWTAPGLRENKAPAE